MHLRQLTERASAIIYHSTGISTLRTILEKDQFRLTPDWGTSAEVDQRRGRDRIYYMSTSRSPQNSYHYTGSGGNCLIVLDGDLFNRRGFVAGPIDYWGGIHNDEMEDRIWHHKPTIQNATQYITAVHAMPNLQYPDRKKRNLQDLRACYIALHRAQIPLYVYTDPDAYRLTDVRRAVPLSSISVPSVKLDPPYQSRRRRSTFGTYTELLTNVPDDRLSRDARRLLYRIHTDSFGDQVRVLSADIHNSRSGRDRPELDRFLARARRLGLRSPQDVIDRIRNSRDI